MLLKNSVEFLLLENGDWLFNVKFYSIVGDLLIGLMLLIVKGSVFDGMVLIDEIKFNGMVEYKVFYLSYISMIYLC